MAQTRFRWYQELARNRQAIYADARRAAKGLGLDRFEGQLGLYPTASSCAGPLADYVLEAIVEANKRAVYPIRIVEDQLRDLVKEVYGDAYDAAATNTCEAALRVSFETLFAPPILRRGEAYRSRFITPLQHDFEFPAAYGRPFPPKYKNIFIDRSVSAGELGVEAKALWNLDALIVPLAGGRFEAHGIKYDMVPFLMGVRAGESAKAMRTVAERHAPMLAGFASLGYDTPGFGFGEKDGQVPRLQKLIGEMAHEYDLPYIVDCAVGFPIIGTDPRRIGADVVMWSMDKSARAPASGLMVGREEAMVPIRKGLGLGGERTGTVSSHGKAVFSMADPGRDAIIGQIEVLKVLRDRPETVTRPLDDLHRIVQDEFKGLSPERFHDGITITNSHGMGTVEVNYEGTWEGDGFGIPMFSAEDLFADSLIMAAIDEMGVFPPVTYGGDIMLSPWQGTTDEEGDLIKENAQLAVRAVVEAISIVCKHAGLT